MNVCDDVCVSTAPATGIRFSPLVGVFRVNEEVVCTAEGYPAPSVHWERVGSNGSRTATTGPVLRITEDMVGLNSWRCRAVNIIGSTDRVHYFTVRGM